MTHSKGKTFAIWGTVLQLGNVVGFFATIIGMMRTFSTLDHGGQADANALASAVSFAFLATTIGLVFSLVGVVLLLIALHGMKYRARWFQTTMWALSVLWLLSFPIGTGLGITVMMYLRRHAREFTEYEPATILQ